MPEIKGQIKEIGHTGEYGQSNFKKRQLLVIEDVEKYPQTLPIDFVQDKCKLLDSYNVGDQVIVGVNLRANEHNGKHYVSIQGWKIEKTVPSTQAAPQSEVDKYEAGKEKTAPEPQEELDAEEEHDDLPF